MRNILSLSKARELYINHDGAHGFDHIKAVVKRVILMSEDVENTRGIKVDKVVIQNAALLHDVTRHTDGKDHHISGAEKALQIIKSELKISLSDHRLHHIYQAILEHRASYSGDFTSIESEILSSADRTPPDATDVMFKRAFIHCMDVEKCDDVKTGVQRAFSFILAKYSMGGYAKFPKVYKDYYKKDLDKMYHTLKNTSIEGVTLLLKRECPKYFSSEILRKL
ncbi:MAG: HD domain-containing protein [Fusobacteriaceae bacterium]